MKIVEDEKTELFPRLVRFLLLIVIDSLDLSSE